MTLTEMLAQHKACLSIPLAEHDSFYSEYYATLAFAENKITVQISDKEGYVYDLNENDGMPYVWAEQITTFVNDLKATKTIPDYTLELIKS